MKATAKLHDLRDRTETDLRQREKELADGLHATLGSLNLDDFATREAAAFIEIPIFCERLTAETEALSEHLTEHYFSHAARRVR